MLSNSADLLQFASLFRRAVVQSIDEWIYALLLLFVELFYRKEVMRCNIRDVKK
jgi:hypothetical protein